MPSIKIGNTCPTKGTNSFSGEGSAKIGTNGNFMFNYDVTGGLKCFFGMSYDNGPFQMGEFKAGAKGTSPGGHIKGEKRAYTYRVSCLQECGKIITKLATVCPSAASCPDGTGPVEGEDYASNGCSPGAKQLIIVPFVITNYEECIQKLNAANAIPPDEADWIKDTSIVGANQTMTTGTATGTGTALSSSTATVSSTATDISSTVASVSPRSAEGVAQYCRRTYPNFQSVNGQAIVVGRQNDSVVGTNTGTEATSGTATSTSLSTVSDHSVQLPGMFGLRAGFEVDTFDACVEKVTKADAIPPESQPWFDNDQFTKFDVDPKVTPQEYCDKLFPGHSGNSSSGTSTSTGTSTGTSTNTGTSTSSSTSTSTSTNPGIGVGIPGP